MVGTVFHIGQKSDWDCGLACVAMVTHHLEQLAEAPPQSSEINGTSSYEKVLNAWRELNGTADDADIKDCSLYIANQQDADGVSPNKPITSVWTIDLVYLLHFMLTRQCKYSASSCRKTQITMTTQVTQVRARDYDGLSFYSKSFATKTVAHCSDDERRAMLLQDDTFRVNQRFKVALALTSQNNSVPEPVSMRVYERKHTPLDEIIRVFSGVPSHEERASHLHTQNTHTEILAIILVDAYFLKRPSKSKCRIGFTTAWMNSKVRQLRFCASIFARISIAARFVAYVCCCQWLTSIGDLVEMVEIMSRHLARIRNRIQNCFWTRRRLRAVDCEAGKNETEITLKPEGLNLFCGHFIVLCGWDAKHREFFYRDPAASSSGEYSKIVAEELDRARLRRGTDEDIIFIESCRH